MKQPKLFTDKDVDDAGQFPKIFADSSELVDAPLDWQKRGLSQTASGYGGKLTGSRKINFNGKLYRIYHTQYSNAGSAWFTVKGRKIYIN
jgi:hypothetical protein